jgi:hypothetical protein
MQRHTDPSEQSYPERPSLDFREQIGDFGAAIGSVGDWDDRNFDWDKAFVASVFAKLAYLHIPELEMKFSNRAKIIPCAEHRKIIQTEEWPFSERRIRSFNTGEFFMVVTQYAVAVVAKIGKVIFISLRGTHYLYDWLLNLNVLKTRPFTNEDIDIYFHKGFYHAAARCMRIITSETLRRYGSGNTIYLTGHSLGGALAAIIHAIWSIDGASRQQFGYKQWRGKSLETHACYTFGMPRYGNFSAIESLESPFHIYNEADIVATVPPKLFGFHDCPMEYCLKSKGGVDSANVKSRSFFKFIFRLAALRGIQEHDIELYIERTKAARDSSESSI